ncbi:MAG: alanine dehydrogenase [Gammaproteobacteria bacterium]|nr:MAG: alanine dehydrogenase [Gammaproteobacteria bacterium]
MDIGLVRERKTGEGRVALVPADAAAVTAAGHRLWVERGAGRKAGFDDADYARAGARLCEDAGTVWSRADVLVKVKEPLPEEWPWLRPGLRLFCFLHLAAQPALLAVLRDKHVTALAFETVQDAAGRLPLLAPMSRIAGRLAVLWGGHYLLAPPGRRGVLLGGLDEVAPARVVVAGAGNAGWSAARTAAALGAAVWLFDRREAALGDSLGRAPGPGVIAGRPMDPATFGEALEGAELFVGAVLLPGARAPRLLSRADLGRLAPGAVLADVSIDQGGCVETSRPTGYDAPVYEVDGVLHFCVANIPGAVPRSASVALSAALRPLLLRLAELGDPAGDPMLAAGINVRDGEIAHPALADPDVSR